MEDSLMWHILGWLFVLLLCVCLGVIAEQNRRQYNREIKAAEKKTFEAETRLEECKEMYDVACRSITELNMRLGYVLVFTSADLGSFDVMNSDKPIRPEQLRGLTRDAYEKAQYVIYLDLSDKTFQVLKEKQPLRFIAHVNGVVEI